MQDIQSIGGNGGDGGRRLRPQFHNHVNHSSSQTMKCPRCESINTKFCYYNNYNLSQPRHFCKSCRRYWTKGGVLRNVPVGGGCRKTKRSKPKQSCSSAPTVAQQQMEEPPVVDQRKSPNSHSSSENSNLTATANTAAAESVSASTWAAFKCDNNNNNNSVLNRNGESKLFAGGSNLKSSCCVEMLEQGEECGILPEMGGFTSLISGLGGDDDMLTPTTDEQREQGESQNQQWKMQGDEDEFGAGRSGGGGFGSLDWPESVCVFDIPSGVDQAGYWSQTQWGTSDQDSTAP